MLNAVNLNGLEYGYLGMIPMCDPTSAETARDT
jgi:hypothetical protein